VKKGNLTRRRGGTGGLGQETGLVINGRKGIQKILTRGSPGILRTRLGGWVGKEKDQARKKKL